MDGSRTVSALIKNGTQEKLRLVSWLILDSSLLFQVGMEAVPSDDSRTQKQTLNHKDGNCICLFKQNKISLKFLHSKTSLFPSQQKGSTWPHVLFPTHVRKQLMKVTSVTEQPPHLEKVPVCKPH